MKVAIRVDASSQIGTGHIMRCLVLAKKLIGHGHEVVMMSRPLTGNLIDHCKEQGIDVLSLSEIQETFLPDNGCYAHWLGVTQEADAKESLALISRFKPDWVVTDHYSLDQDWHRIMRQVGARIMVIDDLANRKHDCDILLDHNPWPNLENRYQNLVPKTCKVMLGPKFALLRERFSILRQTPPAIRNEVLAFFSGTDPSGECIKLLNASKHFSSLPFKLRIVYGMANPRKAQLMSSLVPQHVSLCENLPDYENALAACRYAFGGAGVSAIERASLGVPGTLVSVAENQRLMAEHLGASGLYRYLGLSDKTTEHDYAKELQWLSEHWTTLPYRLEKSDIDGNGAERVVKAMVTRHQPQTPIKIEFRTMTQADLAMVRDWRNAPFVREQMFTQHEIDAEEHERWFAAIAHDDTKRFFIALSQGSPVGMVSFTNIERESNTAEWGFYKAPEAPSGTGFSMLSQAVRLGFNELGLHRIHSRVLLTNPLVIHLHDKLGFSYDQRLQTLETADGHKTYCSFSLEVEAWLEQQK